MKICSTENIKLIGSIEDSIKNNLASEIINRISTDVKKINAEIYLSYPIYINNSTGEKTSVDLTIVCNYGLYMIDIEENKLSDYTVLQDNIYNKAMAKFFKDNSLFKHRKLMFDFNLCTYSLKKCKEVDGYDIVFSVDEFIAYFKKTLSSNPYDCVLLNKMIAAVQESYGINNWTERDGTIEGSKAYLINKMSKNIEKYDSSQMNAILAECDGVQRIRGMAGSGKTVILARKAAELHSKHPDWDIVVTHFTRSLHDQLIDLIDKFYREKNEGASYNDRKLRVMHAWGSHSYNGVYYEISKTHDIHPFTFSEAKERFINNDVLFSKSCLETLRQVDNFKKLYDCILIDEAQDFDKNFMQLCYNVLGKEHRLIYAYDELQKLDREEMPDAITLFGEDIKLDTPLKVCYRNQSRTIVTAHALGMGLYRHEGLVQLPENANVWDSIGYCSDKKIVEGEEVTLYRTSATSPDLLKAEPDSVIEFESLQNEEEMYISLLDCIHHELNNEQLLPSDIMVIDLDTYSYNVNFKNLLAIRRLLEKKERKYLDINLHTSGASNPEDFFRDDSIVYSSVFRAKGNEAFSVFIVNAQKCFDSLEPRADRNALFTSITRSKGWVKVFGYGADMDRLNEEFEDIKKNDYQLHFKKYPDAKMKEEIFLNNRDVNEDEKFLLNGTKALIKKLTEEKGFNEIKLMKELFDMDKRELEKLFNNENE